jgi:hypothetical protein
MNLRQKFAFGSLAVLGLLVAAAMGVLANAIAGDSIGLSAKPLRAGDQLAPAAAGRSSSEGRQGARSGPDRSQAKDPGQATPTTTTTPTTPTTPATPPPVTAVEPGDDHGGAVDNSGPGSLNSGSGSSGEGSGSSGSGSSGSSGDD